MKCGFEIRPLGTGAAFHFRPLRAKFHPMNPRFYFAVCQFGAEKAVKAEVLSEFPHLKFAFSRPGFITFKEENDRKAPILVTSSVFTRLWGQSLGQAKDMDALVTLVKTVPSGSVVHAFERDRFIPGEEPDHFVKDENIKLTVSSLEKAGVDGLKWNAIPKIESTVYDLIWLDEFHVFLGKHFQAEGLDLAPGNQPHIELSPHSPSRAYLKLAEAIHRFKPEIIKGMQALELGCSPGGATTCMLEHDLKVTGIDPRRMDERLYGERNFHFIQKMAIALEAHEIRDVNPTWIVTDLNVAPLEAIDELSYVIGLLRKNQGRNLKLKTGFFTIKLNDWKFADSIPLYLKRIQECGFSHLIPIQLVSNRQEFFVFADGFQN